MKKSAKFIALLFFTIVFLTTFASAQSTEFTFQGQLQTAGAPASGNYDFEFLLFDSVSGGTQLGTTVAVNSVAVANGTFSVKLDFGNQFSGAARFLEIRVRQTGGGSLTTLAPRQKITSAPYGVKALNAENAVNAINSTNAVNATSATTANNALNLGGVAANQYVLTGDVRLSDARNPLPNSPNYIQNTTEQQAASNFNVSGNGSANIFNAATQYNLGGIRILSSNNDYNLFVGIGAGEAHTTGLSNSFFGYYAGNQETAGVGNSFFGERSGFSNITGWYNSFFGYRAGRASIAQENSFFGSFAANFNTTGKNNSFFGYSAGYNNITGNYNTFLGNEAGFTNRSGNYNTFIGTFTDSNVESLTNVTAIGYRAYVAQSNSLILGSINGVNGATADTNVGIGTTAPTQRLDVVGNGLFRGNLTINGTLNATLPAGSSNYIQNTTTVQSGNFNINGNGTLGGTLSAVNVNAASQYNIGGFRVLNINGTNNLFVGVNTGQSTTGSNNTFVGYNVGTANTTGLNNSFFGSQSGAANTMGGYNSFFGFLAGTANVTGASNSFFGYSAGVDNSTGSGNSFFGNSAGRNNTDGILNSFFGIEAGKSNQTGSFNTMIGNGANVGGPSLSNATAIGSRAFVTQNNSLVLGSINGINSADSDTNVGIGTTAPLTRFDVRGSIFIGLTQFPSANFGNSLFLANDNGDSLNSFRLDAADNNLFIIARSASGATTGAGITFRTADSGGGEINRMSINPDGTVSLTTLGSAGSTQLCRNASNQISTCSSSIRYKTNINSFNSGLDLIRKLRPVSFNWKENNLADLGLVAEEVNKVEPLLTTTNEKGEVEGVKYDRVGVVLINAVQEQQTQIEEQQRQINEQKVFIQKQQEEIEALKLKLSELEQLKQLVCAQNSSAQICQPKNQ